MAKKFPNKKGGWKRYEHNGIRYRSKWEIEVAKVFEQCGVNFEYERQDEATRTYPDFYIAELDRYLEVHPDYHGIKKAVPDNCVLVKKLGHARAAACGIALRIKPEGLKTFAKSLSKSALRGLYSVTLDLCVYLRRAIEEQNLKEKS